MGTLQTSGAISLNQLQSVFGGSNPISMSEYYRGGSYVPSTGAGSYTSYQASLQSPLYYFTGAGVVVWNGSQVANAGAGGTSVTAGGYTYQRGSLYTSIPGKYGTTYYYYVRRRQTSVSINTSIPSSGTISMSQFYGGRDP
jgi:hypothetical protein